MNTRKKLIFLLLIVMVIVMGVNLPVVHAVSLPAHVLTGYWHNFDNGARCLRISEVPTSYDIIAVSFADATGTPGAVNFTLDSGLVAKLGGYTEAQFIADIATVKARGQHVIISVGGQNGTVSVTNSAAATNFANSINNLMNKYGFEGVDIDLENGVNATYMAQALRSIRSGSIITMAPQTIDMQSTGMEYFKLALNIKDILTICNMQYYNSGTMLGYDGRVYSQGNVDFLTALATIQLENGLRPDQVGLGLPASTSAAGGGYVAPTVVNQALDCLAYGTVVGSFRPPRTYPAIRGVMTWSINWDASNGYNFANTVRPKLNSLPTSGTTPTPTRNATATPTPTRTTTPTPTPPVGSGIVLTRNGNVLTWTDSANGNDYHVYKNGNWIAWTGNRTYTISGAVSGDTFYVTNGSGSVRSNTVTYGSTATATPTRVATATPTRTVTATPTPTRAATPTPSGYQAWAPNTYYAAGTIVTYGGRNYSCRQSHTSLTGWEPPNVPALWLAL